MLLNLSQNIGQLPTIICLKVSDAKLEKSWYRLVISKYFAPFFKNLQWFLISLRVKSKLKGFIRSWPSLSFSSLPIILLPGPLLTESLYICCSLRLDGWIFLQKSISIIHLINSPSQGIFILNFYGTSLSLALPHSYLLSPLKAGR